MYDETFRLLNSLVSPWHQWLDPVKYGAHVDAVARLDPVATASARGPVLRGAAIADAFDRVRAMAGEPIVAPPGQELLDQIGAELSVDASPDDEPGRCRAGVCARPVDRGGASKACFH